MPRLHVVEFLDQRLPGVVVDVRVAVFAEVRFHDRAHSVCVTLPPLSVLLLRNDR